MSFSVANAVGRLVEGRPGVLRDGADAKSYTDEFRRLIPHAKPRALVLADYRGVAVFPPAVADELARLMADMNPFIERSAILVDPAHATAVLQVGRVVTAAHNELRRRFSDRVALQQWLGEVATAAELARVVAFLDEGERTP